MLFRWSKKLIIIWKVCFFGGDEIFINQFITFRGKIINIYLGKIYSVDNKSLISHDITRTLTFVVLRIWFEFYCLSLKIRCSERRSQSSSTGFSQLVDIKYCDIIINLLSTQLSLGNSIFINTIKIEQINYTAKVFSWENRGANICEESIVKENMKNVGRSDWLEKESNWQIESIYFRPSSQ